ncbi:MAG: hypothetical protein Q7J98_03345 [Kiritimatiellia bacterium]|nr:hypothetical protein [Kiritimatiellia bacterium]
MKTRKLLAVSIVAAWIFSVPCLMAQNAPEGVLQAAVEGLQPFLNKIPADSLGQFGFVPGDDLNTASLGTPFLVHMIAPSAFEKYQTGMTVASIVTPTTTWYFPVLVTGQARAILAVDQIDGQWKAVSLGYVGLARELGAVGSQWKAAQGYHPMLIVVFQAQQYLFTVPEKDAYNLTRLSENTTPSTGPLKIMGVPSGDYATLGNVADMIKQLQPVVQNALK